MSLSTRILAGLLLAAALAGALLWQRNQTLSRHLAEEQAKTAVLEHSLSATRDSLNVYIARTKASTERADRTQKELSRVLQAHPDWRDSPVPDAVFNGLYSDRSPSTASGAAR